MYSAIMVRSLIGEEDFDKVLIGMPDEFFKLGKPVQEDLWRQILMQVNRGIEEIEKLISFAKLWCELYQYENTKEIGEQK